MAGGDASVAASRRRSAAAGSEPGVADLSVASASAAEMSADGASMRMHRNTVRMVKALGEALGEALSGRVCGWPLR